ncbi:hypothetical protein [Bordetella sp. FB-8]|uniref:hypothetical protein n=1 Tax=Bordetella sp. FB-8 TaxID=1159870 RepID=UPI00035E6303|nr:hypothetical protein [Bordetella sp. FB-8]
MADVDLVELSVNARTQAAEPTTVNLGSLDLIHPELYRGDRGAAQRPMPAHLLLG